MDPGRKTLTEKDIEKDWSYFKTELETCDKYNHVLHEIALEFIDTYNFKTMRDNKKIWVFTNPVYEPKGKDFVEEKIVRNLGTHLRPKHINNVMHKIKSLTKEDREQLERNKKYIPLKNGWYDIEEEELAEPKPEIFLTNELDIEYDPEADCPKIKEFCHDIVKDENVKLLQEMVGYTLYKAYPIAKAFMLLGSGSNGKSTFLELLEEFLGQKNVANPSLYELLYNNFAKADLHGKLANIHADLSSGELKKTGNFKMLTGGDRIRAEEKYQNGFTFVNHAKLIYSANELPKSFDDTEAFWRRWITIKFPYKFTSKDDDNPDKDPDILDKLTTEEELQGMFNWAMEGLKRVRKNNGFSVTESCKSMLEGWKAQANPLKTFIEKHVEVHDDAYITKEDFHKAYAAFCEDTDASPMSKQKLGRKVPTMLPETETVRPQTGDKRKTAWDKIVLTGEYKDHQGDYVKDVNPSQQTITRTRASVRDGEEGDMEKVSSKTLDIPDADETRGVEEKLEETEGYDSPEDLVKDLCDSDNPVKFGVIWAELDEHFGLSEEEVEDLLDRLSGDGVVHEPVAGCWRKL